MFARIVIAYDASPPAEKAFDVAVDLALKYGASLAVVAVARPPEFAEDVETEAVIEAAKEHLEKAFGELARRAAERRQPLELHLLVGHPAEQIVHFAEQQHCDLIVTGHRGRTLFQRFRLGSVSRQALHYAHCAVLVVR
jgi:nucleotide-binding universal stress UspA family protein